MKGKSESIDAAPAAVGTPSCPFCGRKITPTNFEKHVKYECPDCDQDQVDRALPFVALAGVAVARKEQKHRNREACARYLLMEPVNRKHNVEHNVVATARQVGAIRRS
jgi:predicted RNA-binding Zn-ribbon protein involved in translation (DUF1610 family)